MRLAEAARARGQRLDGVRLTMGSEPITAARLRTVRDTGAETVARYGSVETGPIAFGCARPDGADDVHVLGELHAVVQTGAALGHGVDADTFLISSLRPTATLLLVNLSLGDGGVLGERRCGCPLDRPGWGTHLRGVRSAEKLTAAGMAFLDTDVVAILEEALPRRFGGGPADYQLVEEEAPDGRPRLRLLVHPRVGPLDPGAVVDEFLRALGERGGAHRVGELAWRGARLLTLERRPPMATSAGQGPPPPQSTLSRPRVSGHATEPWRLVRAGPGQIAPALPVSAGASRARGARSAAIRHRYGGKLGIDATEKRAPLDRVEQPWPDEIRMSDEVRQRVAMRWREYGLG